MIWITLSKPIMFFISQQTPQKWTFEQTFSVLSLKVTLDHGK